MYLSFTKLRTLMVALLLLGISQIGLGQTARVQVIHNSPYAEAAVVDVYINDALAIDDFEFQTATPYLDLPAGVAVKIDITAGDAKDNSSPVFTANLDAGLPADGTLTVVAAGDPLARAGNPAFNLFIAQSREAADMHGNVEFLVFHGSPDAPTVDVVARGAGILVDDFSFGEFAPDYISVPPASYDLDVQTADNSVTAASFNADLSGAENAALTVLASGFLTPPSKKDPGFGLLAVFADGTTALLPGIDPPATPMARVQILHGSPYAEAAVVDIYINGERIRDDFKYCDATPFLDLPAGVPVKIDVTAGDASDNSSPVFTADLADGLPETTLIVVAAGDPLARGDNPAFNLFINEARESAKEMSNAEFLVFHGSPDAPTVDVAARGVGILVDDISFGSYADDYLSVPPAAYEIDVQTADNSVTAASVGADLSGAAGAAIAVAAIGFLAPENDGDPGFELLAVFPDGTTTALPAIDPPPAMARVQVVHNSPYAEAAVVDVYINDGLAIDDFAFRDATPFLDLPAGVPVKIDITGGDAADNSSPVFTADLADGLPEATLVVVAAGDPLARGDNPAFNLFISEGQEVASDAGNVDVLVFHGAPDAPTVDVAARGVGIVVDDISFSEFTDGYLALPPANFELDIQTADNSVTAASFGADLSGGAGAAISVLASGFLAPASDKDPAFGLLAVFSDGTTALLPAIGPPPPPMARVQVVHNSPYAEAAVVDVYINDGLAIDDFAFRDATPFLDLPAGVPVKIDVTGGDAVDNSSPVFTADLADGLPEATLVVVAAGDPLARGDNPAFNLFISGGQEAAAENGNVDVLVFHGSPDAPTVDVAARGVGVVVDDISFSEFTDGYLALPPANFELDIQTADNSVTAASFRANLSGAEGAALAVLASGFLAPASDSDPGFGLLAVFADGTTALLPGLEEDVTFTLIDASTDKPVEGFDPMQNDAELNLSELPHSLSIRANMTAMHIGSVVFDWNDEEGFNTENAAPYSLCQDAEGDYAPCHFSSGKQMITASAFSEPNGHGHLLEMGSVKFSVVNSGNAITGFVLVDADTDEDIQALFDGDTIDLSMLPENLNIRADAGDKVESVLFRLSPNDDYQRIENIVPYALYGDIESDYFAGQFHTGKNTLTATPYSENHAEGEEGDALEIAFNVENSQNKTFSVRPASGAHQEAAESEINVSNEEFDTQIPGSFSLDGNYPNPFNPVTTINFSIPETSEVQLSVFDALGRQVRVLVNGTVTAGEQEIQFDAVGLPSGTYFYKLITPEQSFVKTMLLLK